MAYIWTNYSKEKKYRMASCGISPYIEVWNSEEETVLVNIDIRLYDILVPIEGKDTEDKICYLLDLYEKDERYQEIMNFIIHYMAQLDLKCGLTVQDFMSYQIYKEIEKEYYGKTIKNSFAKLTQKHKNILVRYITKYNMENGREMQLDAVIKAIFEEVNIYYETVTDKIYIYINQEKTDYNIELFHLICYFFKDIDIQVQALWKTEHFGVIEVDETMCIDKIALI